MKTKMIGYWATTAMLAFALTAGGIADLTHPKVIDEGMTHLGYPLYFATILGFWKVLGAIALLAPRLPRLKEWAYAGVFFDMTGAVASHILSGDTLVQFLWPLFFAVCAVASWALRPESRTLGVLFPPREGGRPALRPGNDTVTEGYGGERTPMAGGTV
ncbi:MAG: DoxX family protein [Akkermansiaceae bacterium]|nr:DoxX family protein [Armatimonadota bacterium]